ncbi:hypothetical protein MMC09_006083 [Bachmanniomyces sp. S44760]|nr:hypothetical protein [Bachmanniomyces sp. S44760]
MAASLNPEYPPHLGPAEFDNLIINLKDWSISNGLAVRPSTSLVSKDSDPSGVLAVTAPVTLFPSQFPRNCYEEALAIQKAYNQLYALISQDEEWLTTIVEEIIDVDDFIAKLWNVHLAVKREGYVQNISLGLFRSDYLVHVNPLNPSSSPQIKQVEFNTIASSFGGLSSQVSLLHKYLLSSGAYPESISIDPSDLPENSTIRSLTSGLAAAFHQYGPSKTNPPSPKCIIFIVQDPERNVFDQRLLEYHLESSDRIRTFRVPFAEVLSRTRLPPTQSNPNRPLIYTPPHSPSTAYEVSVIYFRAGYAPTDYPNETFWAARIHLERSAAMKCPTVLTHLAGSKKVQQVLATPSSPHLSRFLNHNHNHNPNLENQIRSTFAAIYPLDNTPAGKHAKSIATDPEKCKNYVLKPQREGGGNNIYRSAIPAFLKTLGEEENWKGHILMEIIEPPSVRNSIFREGVVSSGEVIGELGVYGVCLWRNRGKGRDRDRDEAEEKNKGIIENWEAGYLLRTKGRESEEGGVAAGFGSVDSVYLI